MLSADAAYPPAAAWLRAALVPSLRRLPDVAGWTALRAGAALLEREPGLAARVATDALELRSRPRVAVHIPSGQIVSKAICFVFADGEAAPGAVVKAMVDPRFAGRLAQETDILARLRARLGPAAVSSGLPPAPVAAGWRDGDFVAVEAIDPLAMRTGADERDRALAWLRDFQRATAHSDAVWSAQDATAAERAVAEAWRLAGDADAPAVTAAAARLQALVGVAAPSCAVHGDFWRGNIGVDGAAIRVADWEWATLRGSSLFDLWTYELAEMRWRAAHGQSDLEADVRSALRRVTDELRVRGIDTRWALAMLAPVLAELSFRIRLRIGMPDGMEVPSAIVMRAVDAVIR
jgi:hypothetical protein